MQQLNWDPSMYRRGDERDPASPFYEYDDVEMPEDEYEKYMEVASEEYAIIIDEEAGYYFIDDYSENHGVEFVEQEWVGDFVSAVRWFEANRKEGQLFMFDYSEEPGKCVASTVIIKNKELINWTELESIEKAREEHYNGIVERAKERASEEFDPVAYADEQAAEAAIDRYELERDYYD